MLVALEVGESQKDFIETTNLRNFAEAHMLNADGIPASPFLGGKCPIPLMRCCEWQ